MPTLSDWTDLRGLVDPSPDIEKYVQSYMMLASLFRPKKALEIGTQYGFTAVAFLLACPNANLWTIDIQGHSMAEERAKLVGVEDRLIFVTGDSAEMVPGLRHRFDWIYIDGNHEEAAVTTDLEQSWKKLKPGGVIVIDDYGTYESVRHATHEFAHSNVLFLQPVGGHPHGAVYIVKETIPS